MITPSTLLNVRDIRAELNLSQSELAIMAGISKRAVQSYEQGWRRPPDSVERILLLMLISYRNGSNMTAYCCWEYKRCSEKIRNHCIAYKTRQGHMCWFLTGTLCTGKRMDSWDEKFNACLDCGFMQSMLQPGKKSDSLSHETAV